VNAAAPLLDITIQPNFRSATVRLPNFHRAQAKLRYVMHHNRFVAARCGRRWGKNVLGEATAVDDATHGRFVGWFAPEKKRLDASFHVIKDMLEPIRKRSSQTEGIIETITGGKVEFWSLEDPDAGRSRGYDRAIIDEGAFTKPFMIDTWRKSIRPTLVDRRGRALIMSNTNGIAPDNFLYQVCHEPKLGFVCYHAPSRSNPTLPQDEVEGFERDNEPLVYQQEYLAEFVDWSGAAFFALNKMLVNGQPVELPARCEAVFAVVDSAAKTGKKNDGTGVVFYAVVRNHLSLVTPDGRVLPRYSLVILDWDLVQIEGALLETWLPGVIEILADYGVKCSAAMGSLGVFIEDKSSGMILLQQALRRGLKVHPIDSKLTSVGKDERAISVSGYVYRELVKMSRVAFEKVTRYKDTTRNHLRGQVVGFRVGDKDATREDDLLDCFCYGIAIALGNAEGF
jgi:hypothetical protein